MKRLQYKNLLLALIASVLVAGFQNCSDVEFSEVTGDAGTAANKSNNTLEVGDEVTPEEMEIGLVGELPGSEDGGETPGPNNGNNGNDKNPNSICHKLDIEDVIVTVDHIEIRGASGSVQTTSDGLGPISLLEPANRVELDISSDVSVNQVRLILKQTGNYLKATTGEIFELKTPSQQNSGLKILTTQHFELEGGEIYLLDFNFDPSTQIVHAGKKCILKPVLKATSIINKKDAL